MRPAALVDREAQLGRHERGRVRGAEPVEVGARLAADLDDIGEASGREQGRPRRPALEQRVGRDRRAVREGLDGAGFDRRAGERLRDRGDHADGLVLGRRRGLRGVELAVARGERRHP